MNRNKTLAWVIMSVSFFLAAIAMINPAGYDQDYKLAISMGEKEFGNFKIKRDKYKLIRIENDILKNNAENWKLTYLHKSCLSKEGLRICKGGEAFITVNLKTKKATLGWGE
ncbi:MAG: hypothetical protein ACO1OQ_03770 [Rufibacter sp.]